MTISYAIEQRSRIPDWTKTLQAFRDAGVKCEVRSIGFGAVLDFMFAIRSNFNELANFGDEEISDDPDESEESEDLEDPQGSTTP